MNSRVLWVDNAKAIGMILVFFGHFIEQLVSAGSAVAFAPQKYIYSFHMPFFFFISGFFIKINKEENFKEYFKKKALVRLVPVLFFEAILLPFWLFKFNFNLVDFLMLGKSNIIGHPTYNGVTWFVVCLFAAELYVYFIYKYLTNFKLIVGFSVLILSVYFCNYINKLDLVNNPWYLYEGIVAAGFLVLGNFFFPYLQKLTARISWLGRLSIFLVAALLTWYPAIQNTSIVALIFSIHGIPLFFFMAAILGIIAFITLATLIPVNRVLTFIGENTLAFLGLNGAFVEFINQPLARAIPLSENLGYIMLISVIGTIASMAVCYPVIVLFNKWVPQLVGKKKPTLKWRQDLVIK